MSMNIFERAARNKYRFSTCRGEITAEQLFDLPLLTSEAFCLNAVAVDIDAKMKSAAGTSFVEEESPDLTHWTAKLDIVKHVIATKQSAQKAAEARALKADKRRKLIDALAAAEDRELGAKSREDILKELDALDEDSEAA